MKTKLITLFIVMFLQGWVVNAYAQCCPGIAPLVILPANPTKNDTIRIALTIGTASPAVKMYTTHYVTPGNIFIKLCYASNQTATQSQTFADTVVIGKLPDTTYTVHVKGFYGFPINDSCNNSTDSTDRADSFTIFPPVTVYSLGTSDLSIFPNPVHNTIHLQGINFQTVELLNLHGQVIAVFKSGLTQLDVTNVPRGTYLLRVKTKEKVVIHRIVKN
jgi:hypothetical protein